MNKDTPQSYEYHSHTHCWQDEDPPCGIKGKHRCCLCKLPAPQSYVCDCHEAPEQQEYNGHTRYCTAGLAPQSNTDWREELRKTFQMEEMPVLEEFISQLLEAEKKRRRAEVEGMKRCEHQWSQKSYNCTKCGVDELSDWGDSQYNEALDAVLQKLS